MDEMMLASCLDELEKIAMAKQIIKAVKPAVISTGSKAKATMKPGKSTTNYSTVNTEIPEAAYGSAIGSKSIPPPPVRT